jgi:hypothetical protein
MVVASEPTEDAIFAKDREGAVRADDCDARLRDVGNRVP